MKEEEESEYIKIEKIEIDDRKEELNLKQVAQIMEEGHQKKK